MNFPLFRATRALVQRIGTAATTALICIAASAAPGAHGPNGEHLDEKTQAAAGTGLPRMEAKSDLFELVAQLRRGELSILVDRFATNEPVLAAKLDVESGPLKAVASYRAEAGDYVVTDAAFLKALAAPGEHALVFTLVAGADADLLDGTLVTGGGAALAADHGVANTRAHAHADDAGHSHGVGRRVWFGGGLLVLGLVGGLAWWRLRRRGLAMPSAGVQS